MRAPSAPNCLFSTTIMRWAPEYTSVMVESYLHRFIAFHPVATISILPFMYKRAYPISALPAYDRAVRWVTTRLSSTQR